jgi:hypothetical protein
MSTSASPQIAVASELPACWLGGKPSHSMPQVTPCFLGIVSMFDDKHISFVIVPH